MNFACNIMAVPDIDLDIRKTVYTGYAKYMNFTYYKSAN